MKRLLITAVAFAALLAGGTAVAQPSFSRQVSELLRQEGAGVNVPDARVLFFSNEEADTCVALGIKEGPGELRPGFLIFQLRPEEPGGGKPERMAFEFDKKKVEKEPGLLIWHSCLSTMPLTEGREIQITVRRVRRETQTFVTEFPPLGVAGGLDLWHAEDGELRGTDHITPLEGGGG